MTDTRKRSECGWHQSEGYCRCRRGCIDDTAPTPPEATAAAQDALDAARYRWLRNYEVDSYLACGSKEELDAAIDAAIAAGGEDG